jgi:hypothetical protein
LPRYYGLSERKPGSTSVGQWPWRNLDNWVRLVHVGHGGRSTNLHRLVVTLLGTLRGQDAVRTSYYGQDRTGVNVGHPHRFH